MNDAFKEAYGKEEFTGLELIANERKEQLGKHERTVLYDVKENQRRKLTEAAIAILKDDYLGRPINWVPSTFNKMVNKSYKERLVIAGALLAAEIDRINYVEKNKTS